MANCDDIQIELSAYLDGEASPSERAAVEAHVQSCAACRTLLDELTFAQGSLTSLPKLKAPASLAAAIRQERAKPEAQTAAPQIVSFEPKRATTSWRPALMGIAAMLMAGVLIFLLLPMFASNSTNKTALQEDTRIAPAKVTAPQVAQSAGKPAEAQKNLSDDKAANAAAPIAAGESPPPALMPVRPAAPPPAAPSTAGAREEALEGKPESGLAPPRAKKDSDDEKSLRDGRQAELPAADMPPSNPRPRDSADKLTAGERRNELLAQQHTASAKPGNGPGATLGAPKAPAAAPAPSRAADGARPTEEEAAQKENWKDSAAANTKQKEATEPLKPPQEQLSKQQDAQSHPTNLANADNSNGAQLAGGQFGAKSDKAISGNPAQTDNKADRADRLQNGQPSPARKTPQVDDEVAVRERAKADEYKPVARATTKTLAPAESPAPTPAPAAVAPGSPNTPSASAATPVTPVVQAPAKSQAIHDLAEKKALPDRGVSADAEAPQNSPPGGANATRKLRSAIADQRRIVCRKDELDGVLAELQNVAQQSGGSLAAPSMLAVERGQAQAAAKGSEAKKSGAEDGLKKDAKDEGQSVEQELQDKAAELQPARNGRTLTFTLTVSAGQKQAVLDKIGNISPAFNKRNATRVGGDKRPAKDAAAAAGATGGAGGGPGGQTSSGGGGDGGGDDGGPADLDAGGHVMNQPHDQPAANGFVEKDEKAEPHAKNLDAANPDPGRTRDDLVTITIEIETLP